MEQITFDAFSIKKDKIGRGWYIGTFSDVHYLYSDRKVRLSVTAEAPEGVTAFWPTKEAAEGFLDEQCGECIHADADGCCPVALVQAEFNYTQLKKGNENLKKAMEILIDKKGSCNVKKAIESMGKVNPNKRCFQRPLVFGDEEQIAGLNINR